jgi:hypothetical protein
MEGYFLGDENTSFIDFVLCEALEVSTLGALVSISSSYFFLNCIAVCCNFIYFNLLDSMCLILKVEGFCESMIIGFSVDLISFISRSNLVAFLESFPIDPIF